MRHAMADPEIQSIMRDPVIQQILRDMQENPVAGQAALRDPSNMAKIQKLIAAGVLKTA
jgi:stress-induced-phosphoprotein 1